MSLPVELIRLRVDVLIAASHPATLAARKATSEIPIVMAGVGDALRGTGSWRASGPARRQRDGHHAHRPRTSRRRGWNWSGSSPRPTRVGFLWNAALPFKRRDLERGADGGEQLTLTLRPLDIRRPEDLEPAFALRGPRTHSAALFVRADPLTLVNRERIVKLAAQYHLIAM